MGERDLRQHVAAAGREDAEKTVDKAAQLTIMKASGRRG